MMFVYKMFAKIYFAQYVYSLFVQGCRLFNFHVSFNFSSVLIVYVCVRVSVRASRTDSLTASNLRKAI